MHYSLTQSILPPTRFILTFASILSILCTALNTHAGPSEKEIEYEQQLQEVIDLEEKAKFSEALQKAQNMMRKYREKRRELSNISKRLRKERQTAASLKVDLKKLGSSEKAVVEMTRRKFLSDGGRGGRILLRNVVLEEEGQIVKEAISLLLEMRDQKTAEAISAKLAQRPEEEMARYLLDKLEAAENLVKLSSLPEMFRHARSLIDVNRLSLPILQIARQKLAEHLATENGRSNIAKLALSAFGPGKNELLEEMKVASNKFDATFYRKLWEKMQLSKGDARRSYISLLISAMADKTNADPEKFNQMLNTDNAYSELKIQIETAMQSSNGELAAWGYSNAAPFDLLEKGFRGTYFADAKLNEVYKTRRDKQIVFVRENFALPPGTESSFSARWEGQLRVETPGTYTFYLKSYDGHRLSIDGKKIADKLDWGQQSTVYETELDAGMHSLKIEYQKGLKGGAYIYFLWQGPGFGKRFVDDKHVFTKAEEDTLADEDEQEQEQEQK